jgi:hypothetical protein
MDEMAFLLILSALGVLCLRTCGVCDGPRFRIEKEKQ